jgi:hypothetical protein
MSLSCLISVCNPHTILFPSPPILVSPRQAIAFFVVIVQLSMHDTMAHSLTEPDAAVAVSSESSTRDRFYSILRKPASSLALRISDLDRYRLNMWEVSWAAPKESRKEHRENKATTAKSATKARSIFSRGSNSSNEAPLFGNSYNKTKNAERASDSVSSTSSKASAGAGNYELEADEASTFSVGSEQTTINMARVVDLSARKNGQIKERSQGLRRRAAVVHLMLMLW